MNQPEQKNNDCLKYMKERIVSPKHIEIPQATVP